LIPNHLHEVSHGLSLGSLRGNERFTILTHTGIEEAGRLVSLEINLFVVKAKVIDAVLFVFSLISLEGILTQNDARVVVRQNIFVSIELEKSGVGADEEVVGVILVGTNLLDDSVFHLLTVSLDRALLKELRDRNFSLQLLQLFALVH
jgi:hypothetical protein